MKNISVPRFKGWYAPLFFLLFLLVGLFILDDYGISWDESIQRRHGRVSIDYAAKKLGVEHTPLEPEWDLEDYQWQNYGMLYSITGNLLELGLGYEDDPYQHYKVRHYVCFLLFWIALIFFYRSIRLRFPERAWYPLIGTLALILSPRIFAHAFFNPKDHILLVFYLINTYTLLRLLKHRNWSSLVLHALATGLALNTRLPALIVPLTTFLILGWELLRTRPFPRKNLAFMAAYLPLSVLFLVPFFPYLWEDTLSRLVGAFSEMSAFNWDSYVWLFGDRISALDVPAYYIPAWILITTPLVYLLFIFTGLYATVAATMRNLRRVQLWKTEEQLLDFTQLGLAVGPILVVIILGSTLYNGWRHLHFVFPSFIFLMMVGFDFARRSWKRPVLVTGLLAAGLLMTAVQMVRYHPHQYVYFNFAITGEPLIIRFDMDYWGVGFRDAFLKLAEQVPEGETRSVKCEVWPCKDNYYALPPAAKEKLRLEGAWHRADYLMTNFIWPNTRFDLRDRKEHFAYPALELRPAGQLTIGVYDLNQARENQEKE
ncbi:glycosyltransferase family 39 protein [Lewinella sp. W8]|uniref:glycosyltransferase family 39 protein n=1 Tax=Lewinella sp. W8 TaxID=2528208 RepID=UPI00106785B5|nr:glycosyltransferase family 39 protein [Lewinella sp. W8]MTB49996.1 hypothetical protein [Lewinella sp. W8]